MSGKRKQSGLTRRSFLKTTATVTGAAVLASAFGCSSIDTSGNVPAQGEERVAITGCMYGGCASCQAKVIIRDEKVVNIMTDPDEVRGNRPCLRGRSHINRIYGNQRIKYPMKRAGERGEGKWEQITWEEALATIAEKWLGYAKEFGSASIVVDGSGSKGGGYLQSYRINRLRNIMGWTESMPCNDFAMAKGMNKVFGPATNTWGFPPFEIQNLVHSNTLVSWSGNISVASTQDWRWIMEAKEQGTKLVTVDPVYTVLAQKSDLWVRPRPGTDTVLILAIVKYLIDNELYDKEYTTAHTAAPILIHQDTGAYLRMSDIGVAPVEGPINPMTGQPSIIDPPVQWDLSTKGPVPLDTAVEATVTGSFTIAGIKVRTAFDMLVDRVNEFSLERAEEMTEVPVETIIELAKICADTPLYHYIGYGSQAYNNGVQNGHALATLGALTGNIGKLGAGVGNGWHGPTFNLAYSYPTGFGTSLGIPGLALMFDIGETGMLRGKPFPLKSLYLCGSSKVGGWVDTNRVLKDFEHYEFIVCQDIIFCDAASHADILLPASHYFEYEEIFSAGVHTLYNERAIEPLYETKPDGEIACLLGKALGVGEYFDMTDDEFLHLALDSDSMRALDLTVENIKAKKAVRFMPENYIANADGIFPTATGRLEFYVDAPTPRVDYGQTIDADAERLPRWFPPTEAWHENPLTTQYPLVFMSERARARYHTQNFESEWINELEPEPIIRMNPDDAAFRNITEGDYVYVENTRGHAVGRARLSSGIRPGIAIYPKGWQMFQFKTGCWGALHNSEFDLVGCNSSYFDSLCEISPWTGQGGQVAVNPSGEVQS